MASPGPEIFFSHSLDELTPGPEVLLLHLGAGHPCAEAPAPAASLVPCGSPLPVMVVAAEAGTAGVAGEAAESGLQSDQLGPVDGWSKDVGECLADFELVAELGRGTYGVVHKVRSKKDGKIYCLKKVKCGRLSAQRQREVLMEVLMLRRLSHKHVIGYYTSFVEKKSLYILMEFASNGDLQRVLDEHKRNKTYVPEKMLWRIVYELAQAHILKSTSTLCRDFI